MNPRRMRQRVTVVVFVCVSVCSTSTRFIVDLHGPSKVPTSFKRYSITLNMIMLKMFCSRDMALFTYPGYLWQFLWMASTATVRYYE